MAKTQFTPGPWRNDPELGDLCVLRADGYIVADHNVSSFDHNAPSEDEMRANARLVAAAPMMHTALTALIFEFQSDIGRMDEGQLEAWDKARAALAQAGG